MYLASPLFNGGFTGKYSEVGTAVDADCAIGFEFTHRSEAMPVGHPNIEIAVRINEEPATESLELFVSHSITRGLQHIGSPLRPTYEFVGDSAKGIKENLGTYGEWLQAFELMHENKLNKPLIFSSAWNMGNLLFQGMKISKEIDYPITPIILHSMPSSFDKSSDQYWTQSVARWRALNHIRQIRLRLNSH